MKHGGGRENMGGGYELKNDFDESLFVCQPCENVSVRRRASRGDNCKPTSFVMNIHRC